MIIAVCSMLTACGPQVYYQMYQTKPVSEDIQVKENSMIYEDDNCTVVYDFWGANGNIGFVMYNKSSENLFVHLDETFFVKNGFANDYYLDRTWTSHSSYGSPGMQVTRNVTTAEKKVICIPPKASKLISEYNINDIRYFNCDLNDIPSRKGNNSLTFDKDGSPYKFGNVISYSMGNSEEKTQINNEFYVSQITNYSHNSIVKYEYKVVCGKQTYIGNEVFKESGPDKFFIKYVFY